ncbi:MAG: TonB family protein [Nitrospinota bacterium]
MTRFIFLSMALHFFFAVVSEIMIDVLPTSRPKPIKVSVMKNWPKTNLDIDTGKIMETPKPEKEEIAEDAEILAQFDSKANAKTSEEEKEDRELSIPKKSLNSRRDAKPDKDKKPPTVLKPTEKVAPKPPEMEDTVMASIALPFMEKVTRPEDIEDQTSHLQFDKIYERAMPKPPAVPEDTREEALDTQEPQKGKSALDGDQIDLFVMENPHKILETDEEIVISLNTKKFAYFAYFKKIRQAVEKEWYYPDEAILNGISGQSLLRFTLSSDGNLEGIKVVSTSGEKVLDAASIRAIEDAQPFQPFPQGFNKKKVHIVATFTYESAFDVLP